MASNNCFTRCSNSTGCIWSRTGRVQAGGGVVRVDEPVLGQVWVEDRTDGFQIPRVGRDQSVEVPQAFAGIQLGQYEICELLAGGGHADQTGMFGPAGSLVAGGHVAVHSDLVDEFGRPHLEYVTHRA